MVGAFLSFSRMAIESALGAWFLAAPAAAARDSVKLGTLACVPWLKGLMRWHVGDSSQLLSARLK